MRLSYARPHGTVKRRFGYAAQVRRSAADRIVLGLSPTREVHWIASVGRSGVSLSAHSMTVTPSPPIRSTVQIDELGHGVGPIGVDVIDEEAALVLVDEDERRLVSRDCRAETSRQPPERSRSCPRPARR